MSLRCGFAKWWGGRRYDLRAVNEVVTVVAEKCELRHGGCEVAHHKLLVIDHALPLASSALLEIR